MGIRYFDEVTGLHRFIQAWLTGELPKTQEAFARFRGALADDFLMVSPRGNRADKARVADGLWDAHASQEPSFVIEIRNLSLRLTFGSFTLITYEEWQSARLQTARLSTVLFRTVENEDRVRWVHVHETWLPGMSDDRRGGR
jgi:hypothetical protein